MAQNKGFAGLDAQFTSWDASRIAVLPIPYDKTSTWNKGADKGPLAVIDASPALELYDVETDSEVFKQGIYTCPSLVTKFPPEKMVQEVEESVSKLMDAGKFVIVLGGEHSVSIGSIRAHSKRIKDLCVLQLDAHSDLRDEYEESRYNHACVMARVKESCPAVQVGIRSMCVEEKDKLEPENVFFAEDIINDKRWIDNVLDRLLPNVYVTIDLDVFDPSMMSATGTPEPGGLGWYDVVKLLRAVAEKRKVVGFDCVELCPDKINRAPDFTAAKLIYKFLSYVYKNA